MSEAPESQPYGLLSKEELEAALQTRHAAAEYLDHAYRLCTLVRASEEGERTFLHRRGPAKQLCDEMVPIGYLCRYFLSRWPGTEVQLVLGSQQYDAIVSHPEALDELPSHIEVTGLDLDNSHKLRHTVASNGVASEIFNGRERLAELSSRLRRAIKDKSTKPYPRGTLLLIFQKTDRSIDGWMDVMFEVADELRNELSCFKRVIVMNQRSINLDFEP